MAGSKKEHKTSASNATKKNEEESAELVRIIIFILYIFCICSFEVRPKFVIK
jgi:hypothetical protein